MVKISGLPVLEERIKAASTANRNKTGRTKIPLFVIFFKMEKKKNKRSKPIKKEVSLTV